MAGPAVLPGPLRARPTSAPSAPDGLDRDVTEAGAPALVAALPGRAREGRRAHRSATWDPSPAPPPAAVTTSAPIPAQGTGAVRHHEAAAQEKLWASTERSSGVRFSGVAEAGAAIGPLEAIETLKTIGVPAESWESGTSTSLRRPEDV